MSGTPTPPSGSGTLARVLLASARSHLEHGQLTAAEECLTHAAPLFAQAAPDLRALGFLLTARLHVRNGAHGEAEAAFRESIAASRTVHEFESAAETLRELAELLHGQGRLEEAEQELREALRLSSGAAPGPLRARLLEDTGRVLRLRGQGEPALEALEEALRVWQAIDDAPGRARAHRGIGNALLALGRNAEALVHHQATLAFHETLGERLELAKSLNNVGTTLLNLGDYAGAEKHLIRAEAIFRELRDDGKLAHSLSNLGLLSTYRAETARARGYLKESLRLFEETQYRHGEASCANNLANVAFMSGQPEDAERWARKSIEIKLELGEREGLGKPWFNLAQACLRLGRVDDAAAAAHSVRGLAESTGSLELRAEASLLEAELALFRNRPSEALAHTKQAIENSEAGGYPRQLAEALRLQADAHLQRGEREEAREALLDAERAFRDLSAPLLLAQCRLSLGRLFLEAGAPEAAAERLRRARDAFATMENRYLEARTLVALALAENSIDPTQATRTLDAAAHCAGSNVELSTEIEAVRARWAAAPSGPPAVGDPLRLLGALRLASNSDLQIEALLRFLSDCGLRSVYIAFDPDARRWWGDASQFAGVAHVLRSIWSDPRATILADGDDRVCLTPALARDGTVRAVLASRSRRGTEDSSSDLVSPALQLGAELLGLTWLPGEDPTHPARGPLTLFHEMAGRSPAMLRVYRAVERAAPRIISVLILGESGTGKELVARAIHRASPRCAGPFVAISCPSIPRDLIEAELFGHEKGAFTGAHADRAGRIEAAHGGTLFLDEIGDIDLATQSKLLRFLQEREFQRLGGRGSIAVDVRLLAATSRDLTHEIRAGRFREDLFYRLNVVPIDLPPLRERGDDIVDLAEHFLESLAPADRRDRIHFAPDALECLRRHRWPGNVRELRNAVEFVLAMSADDVVTAAQLPDVLRRAGRTPGREADADTGLLRPGESLDARLIAVEGEMIRKALEATAWNQLRAARLLGITESRIRHRMKRYGIAPPGVSSVRPRRRGRPSQSRSLHPGDAP